MLLLQWMLFGPMTRVTRHVGWSLIENIAKPIFIVLFFLIFSLSVAVIVSDRLLLDDWTTTTNTGHRIVPSLYHGVHKTPIQSTAEEVRGILIHLMMIVGNEC